LLYRLSHHELHVAHPLAFQRSQEIEQELNNLVSSLTLTSAETVRQRLVNEMEKLQIELEHIRQQEQNSQIQEAELLAQPLSAYAMQTARKSAKIIETLRTKWDKASLASRQALKQWVIDSVIIAPVPDDRKLLQGHITWRGGIQSPIEIVRKYDRRQEWDEREKEVIRLWYTSGRWEDLDKLLCCLDENVMQFKWQLVV
jgi:regulator of replication initiation timing